MKFIGLVFSVLLISLAVMSMIMFTYEGEQANNADSSILNDPKIASTFSRLNDTVNDQLLTVNSTRNNFQKESPTIVFSLIFLSIINAAKLFTNGVVSLYDITLGFVFSTLFGGDSKFLVILGVLGGIIIMIAIVVAYNFFGGREQND